MELIFTHVCYLHLVCGSHLKFYFLAAEIIENFAIRSFKRANFELETKLKQYDLQCKQLNEQLNKDTNMNMKVTG